MDPKLNDFSVRKLLISDLHFPDPGRRQSVGRIGVRFHDMFGRIHGHEEHAAFCLSRMIGELQRAIGVCAAKIYLPTEFIDCPTISSRRRNGDLEAAHANRVGVVRKPNLQITRRFAIRQNAPVEASDLSFQFVVRSKLDLGVSAQQVTVAHWKHDAQFYATPLAVRHDSIEHDFESRRPVMGPGKVSIAQIDHYRQMINPTMRGDPVGAVENIPYCLVDIWKEPCSRGVGRHPNGKLDADDRTVVCPPGPDRNRMRDP